MGRPHLAQDPVVRIDEDVEPSASFFERLLEGYQTIEHENDFYFFSGIYGTGSTEDPINDFAARTHFFLDVPWRSGSRIKSRKTSDRIKMFLSDLSILGAPQYPSDKLQFSARMQELVNQGVGVARKHPQCISGAGLIMSRNAVELLPPFTSFNENDVWVDDHVKRRLHEALRHLDHDDPEIVESARAAQNRHPDGVGPKDLAWAKKEYFDRVLRVAA